MTSAQNAQPTFRMVTPDRPTQKAAKAPYLNFPLAKALFSEPISTFIMASPAKQLASPAGKPPTKVMAYTPTTPNRAKVRPLTTEAA